MNHENTRLRRPDITLSSGKVLTHTKMDSGAWYMAPAVGPDEISEDEWQEYCSLIIRKVVTK